MKKSKKQKYLEMGAILAASLMLLFLIIASIKCDGQVKDTAYIISIDYYGMKARRVITYDSAQVNKIYNQYFKTDINAYQVLKNNPPFMDVRTQKHYFYAGIGTIKVKKNGKHKFKHNKK